MVEWSLVQLEHVADVVGRGISPVYIEDDGVLVLNQKCVRDGRVLTEPARRHDALTRSIPSKKLLSGGEILINSTGVGTLGRTAFVGKIYGPMTADSHVTIVRAKSGFHPRWLGYAIRNLEPDIEALAIGSTGQTELGRSLVCGLPINVPPLAEQRAIAGVLGALDDKIESNRRIVKQMELLLLAHSNSLSTLPRVALHEVSKSYRRPVNPLVLGEEWVDHFSLPAFDVAAMPERCQASSIMSGKFGIETTSVLISRLNPGTPRVWCAHVREVPAMCSSEFLVLEPLKKSSVGALWLAAVHPSLGEQMVQRATGTSFSHQRIKSDDALSVEVPDIRMIDDQVRTECDELIEMVGKRRSENEHLSRLRDVLLPELLSGRLRVNDAESMMENV